MIVRFWGTRGSVPVPGPTTLRYGGNTTCVEVRANNALFVLDCGTGVRELGLALARTMRGPLKGHILLSHTHWDHIQGFPFFAPALGRENFFVIHSAHDYERKLDETLAGQMEHAYFPVKLEQMGARMVFKELVPGDYEHSGVEVGAFYLHHTMLTLGYRLRHDGQTMVFACDNEPRGLDTSLATQFWEALDAPEWRSCVLHPEDRRFAEQFAAGADLLIHDAQYTAAEYHTKIGWGHSPFQFAVDMAILAGVRRLALFHHDPMRSDEAVDRLLALARERVAAAGATLEVFAAAEGMELDLHNAKSAVPAGDS